MSPGYGTSVFSMSYASFIVYIPEKWVVLNLKRYVNLVKTNSVNFIIVQSKRRKGKLYVFVNISYLTYFSVLETEFDSAPTYPESSNNPPQTHKRKSPETPYIL